MILNTRPAIYKGAFEQTFGELGRPLVACPMLAIENLDAAWPASDLFDSLIFTSQIAVAAFPRDSAWLQKLVFAVGEATADLARDMGFERVVCTGENAADLRTVLAGVDFAQALYPSARDVASDLSIAFPSKVTRVIAYQSIPTPYLPSSLIHRLNVGEATYAPLFSLRTAHAFNEALRNAGLNPTTANITAIGISPAINRVETPLWRRTLIAQRATSASMAAALRADLRDNATIAA